MRKPSIEKMEFKSLVLPGAKPRFKGSGGKRCLKCKVRTLARQIIQTCEHESTGLNRDAFGPKGGQTAGNIIRVYKLGTIQISMEQGPRSSAFPGTIWDPQ
jgi:hypothetical protein